VVFGPVDASDALVEAKTASDMTTTPTGEFRFDFSHSTDVVDYFGELRLAAIYQGRSWPIFRGSVMQAIPAADHVMVHAVGTQQLRETVIPDMVVRGVSAPEMIYVLARSSGIREERLNIEGLESLLREQFEIIVPVDGIVTSDSTKFAGVEFLPTDSGVMSGMPVSDTQRAGFTASAYARAWVTTTMMLEAEQKGLASVDLALAWLTAQLRCGAAMLPRGKTVAFDRQESLTQPRRRGLVSVRGTTSGRHWLRRPQMAGQESKIPLGETVRPLDDVIPELSLQEQQAFLALGRAVREPDLLVRVQNLWEAIEFYCSGVSVDPLFTTEQLETINRSLPTLESAQRERMTAVIGQLNSAPLLIRLKKAIQDDNAPVTNTEVDLLQRLRKLRNDVVHGRRSRLPVPEDVEYAASVVARLLMYRAAQLKAVATTE
jgi:hypothetical protein